MDRKQFEALRAGDRVRHQPMGPCQVIGHVLDLGPVLMPLTAFGWTWLSRHAGTAGGVPYLEMNERRIAEKINPDEEPYHERKPI